MRITSADEAEWERYAGQREGRTDYKLLARGEAGTPDNYELTLIKWSPEGTYSPRHHHNFDQFRYPLNMPLNYSANLDVPVGHLGYFAEGGYYGPQKIKGGCLALMLQFAGPTGHGFMSYPETRRGSTELKQRGRFEKGIYRYEDETGTTRNQDGYEAVWEHVNGRGIEYVRPRFTEPVVMDPEAFGWQPLDSGDGVFRRALGVFNERGTAANEYRLDTDGSVTLVADGRRRLFFVVSGEVDAGGTVCRQHAAVSLEPAEKLDLRNTGNEPCVVLNFDLPAFAE
ncbi:MAG TPA: hypothetical protein VFW65_23025 [Pseudonocardiaceae bacterium]|nr:hypothetical protein [Pseudonocardiaceae bacterium]